VGIDLFVLAPGGPIGMYHWEADVDEVALRHGAGVEHETNEAKEAYARFPPRRPTAYRDGWLPD
jgi:hypothetical protein